MILLVLTLVLITQLFGETPRKKRNLWHVPPKLPAPSWANTFYIVWTTTFDTWGETQNMFLDMLFIHHPDAHVVLICINAPPGEILEPYNENGYRLRAFLIEKHIMVQKEMWVGPQSRAWVMGLNSDFTRNASFFHLHFTDYMRCYMLYKFGGTYLDMGSLTIRPYPAHEFVGIDESPEERAEWFWNYDAYEYLSPRVLKLQPGKCLPRNILENHFDPASYNPDCLNCLGPKALNVEFKRLETTERESIILLPKYKLYPLPDSQAGHVLYGNRHDAVMLTTKLLHSSGAVHLFEHKTRDHSSGKESVLNHLSKVYRLRTINTTGPDIHAPNRIVLRQSNKAALQGPNLIYVTMSEAVRFQIQRLDVKVDTGTIIMRGLETEGAIDESQHIIILGPLTIAEVNRLLSTISYNYNAIARDAELSVAAQLDNGSRITTTSHILIFNRWVTFITHTHGRHELVERLHKSIQTRFPGTEHLATNDLPNDGFLDAQNRHRHLKWVPTVRDAGLSACRNTMIKEAHTDLVFLIDDDFILDEFSILEALLQALVTTGFDIIAPKIPADIQAYHIDFCGLLQTNGANLSLAPGSHGSVGGCAWVDFVPNVFLGRRSALLGVLWDPYLKLGEHEEFFLRAKQHGLRILSCDHIFVTHYRRPKWSETYTADRKRVHEYFKYTLKKHSLTRLVSFGSVQAELPKR